MENENKTEELTDEERNKLIVDRAKDVFESVFCSMTGKKSVTELLEKKNEIDSGEHCCCHH